ncbi:MAG: cytochrome o ubiquinol oxidase subunit [Acidimicrobiia bacterium]|nr:cytochrome o ubiquinol oxidase subunit [Acidimicrobiia bacterium]
MAEVLTADAPAAAGHDDHGGHDPHHTNTGISNEKLAMWLFLGSECLLFGGLISTYLLYRYKLRSFPGFENVQINRLGAHIYDIPFTSVSSFVLLMSSLTMVLAHSALTRNDHQRTRIWLMTTALLGATFISGQVYEFTAFYREGLGYTTNIFSSAFFTLTGFHGVHVTVGIIMLLSMFVQSARGRLAAENAERLEIVGLYWHFVDVVWVVIFAVVYLIP